MSATIVEAVVKLATKVKGETVKPANATIAAALDTLADALAGENVQAKPTIASAIDMITENYIPGGGVKPEGTITITENGEGIDVAQYATADVSVSGGGGGVDVGAPVDVRIREYEGVPTVGDPVDAGDMQYVTNIAVGDAIIAADSGYNSPIIRGISFAAGTTLTTKWLPAFGDPTQDAAFAFLYTVETVEEDGYDIDYYKTVTILQDAVTMETDENSGKRYTFTVPEVEEGMYFAVNLVANWD